MKSARHRARTFVVGENGDDAIITVRHPDTYCYSHVKRYEQTMMAKTPFSLGRKSSAFDQINTMITAMHQCTFYSEFRWQFCYSSTEILAESPTAFPYLLDFAVRRVLDENELPQLIGSVAVGEGNEKRGLGLINSSEGRWVKWLYR